MQLEQEICYLKYLTGVSVLAHLRLHSTKVRLDKQRELMNFGKFLEILLPYFSINVDRNILLRQVVSAVLLEI
jgi:hypothetical protein